MSYLHHHFPLYSLAGGGSWSTEGCWLANQTEDGQFICKCNHLTTFSLLMVSYDPSHAALVYCVL